MKRILTLAIGLLLGWSAQAQIMPELRPLPEYSFAHFDRNQILYPGGDSTAMERFYEKLDSVVFHGQGNVSIMHIGGSHVQAGVFTQQFRDNLLSIRDSLMGGSYFLFPFTAGGTNNPSHYVIHSTGEWQYCRNAVRRETDKRMGLAGAAVTTSDTAASIQIVARERYPSHLPPTYEFNKVTLIGFSEVGDVVPVLGFYDDTLRADYNDTLATYTFVLPDYTDSVCVFFDSIAGEFTLTGVLLENDLPGISVHGVGVNGASVPSYLRCDDFERDLDRGSLSAMRVKGGALSVAVLFLVFMPCAGMPKPNWVGRVGSADMGEGRPPSAVGP